MGLITNPLQAQKAATIINASLTKPEKAIMYIGVNNVIRLYGEIPGKYIRLERSGGPLELKAGTGIQTTLKYTSEGHDTLRIYDNEKLIIEKVYEVRALGKYEIGIKSIRDSVVTLTELLKAKELEVYMPGEYYRPKAKVTSFIIRLENLKNKKQEKIQVIGNNFTKSIEAIKQNLVAGSFLVFEKIKISDEKINLSSDVIKIKIGE